MSEELIAVKEIFPEPFDRDRVVVSVNKSNANTLHQIQDKIREIELLEIGKLSLEPNLRLWERSKGDQEELSGRMKVNPNWIKAYEDALDASGAYPIGDLEDSLKAIMLPGDSSVVVNFYSARYEGGLLKMDGYTISFLVTQLARKGMIDQARSRNRIGSSSLYGVVMCGYDESIQLNTKVVFGKRGGRTYVGGVMPVPAGSLGENPFETAKSEITEELGLIPGVHVDMKGIVGVFEDRRAYHFVDLVFLYTTHLSAEEVANHWGSAVDKKEHTEIWGEPLIGFPQYILDNAEIEPRYPADEVKDRPLLYQAMGPMMVTYAHVASIAGLDMGVLYKTLERFGGRYKIF